MKFSGSLSEADEEKARYVLVGVPFDGNAFKKGAREGPRAIRTVSQRLETFLWDRKFELSDLYYYDSGDIPLEQFTRGESARIEECNLEKKKIFIGGDHSISYPIVKYLFEHGEVDKVITIDAHADFRDSYKNNRISNACVMRRIAELIGFENVVEIGIRSSSEEEYVVFKDKIRLYDAALLKEKGLNGLLGTIGDGTEKTYLSIDIDVLDPGIAPGVEHPEPCGMSLEDLIALIRGLLATKNVVASDLVEVNPRFDNASGITSLNAARIIFELLACYGTGDR
ncbi:MAG: agmatinase [Methanomicrobia archaeon]|nr:agmatinase [Methanomicrobia archaeon]